METHYIRWSDSHAAKGTAFKAGESRALRLGVAFDTTEAKIGEPVRCTVEAERMGFSGYGMLLAKIGLPPGADVDRSSLEKAMEDNLVDQYDVCPIEWSSICGHARAAPNSASSSGLEWA